jgi:sugar lactone lactonase YvrE
LPKTFSASLFVDCRCTLGEGILWWEQRRALLWTDIERSALWMHSVEGHHTSTWTLPDRLGSLAICESGRLLLGLAKGLFYGDFARATDKVMEVERIVAVDPDLNRHRINDGRTDRSGNFVFGTMNEAEDAATGSFYQFSAAHGLRRLDLGGVTIPNSICFSLDGLTMYFCDSKRRRIRQCDYDAASALVGNVRDFVRFAAGDGLPDGSVIDNEGCLWNAGWGAGVVRRFAPDGGLLATVQVPAKNATCAAFGGHNLADLYVTSARQQMTADELEAIPDAGGVYRAEVGTIGVEDAQFRD